VREPHDPPSAVELVEAVREFLREDVMPATEGRVQYLSRVAANVLGIVARELEQGESQEAEHRARLEALGHISDTELARAIRDGAVDHHDRRVLEAVEASVTDKLRVARPRYLEQA
jgi:hypothetical protein